MLNGLRKTKVSEEIDLFTLDLRKIGQSDGKLIDKHIVEICEGQSGSDVELVKKNLLKFIETKSKETKYGAVAEFFVHLCVREMGLRQEFLFRNLEEGSIKKGFDGYFSQGKNTFMVESKSGACSTKNISHTTKIKEAYNDLKGIVSGNSSKSKNNPWRNAYNHARHADVGSSKSIYQKLKILSDKYDEEDFGNILDFRIIVASTIFRENNNSPDFHSQILSSPKNLLEKFKSEQTKIICLTKQTYEAFILYLKDEL
ncbi:hypothetical protein ACO1HB_13550 [Alteromonas macleodii]|uniref:hypothetical protein n=1 Tax=Alteromonas macleodii TaxID=28108 RepID=UPI003BF86A72